MRIFLFGFFIFISICTSPSFAQKKGLLKPRFVPELMVMEDSLKRLAVEMVKNPDDFTRKNTGYLFIRTLVYTLKLPNSFEYPFDSLYSIALLKDSKNKFRIFNWHILNYDKTYSYYGAIQVNNSEKLELYPLFDYTEKIKNPEDTILKYDYWYGAHYYKLIETLNNKTPYYVLLGWKGNNDISTKKVIDVLSFKEGKPYFGAPLFEIKEKGKKKVLKKRVIFEYNVQATMLLRYLEKKKWIIFDHLVPMAKGGEDLPEMYVPDLSYDGFRFRRGKWLKIEKLDLRNEKSELDRKFVDPTIQ